MASEDDMIKTAAIAEALEETLASNNDSIDVAIWALAITVARVFYGIEMMSGTEYVEKATGMFQQTCESAISAYRSVNKMAIN